MKFMKIKTTLNKIVVLGVLGVGLLSFAQPVHSSPLPTPLPGFGGPTSPGKFTAQDVNLFMENIPDDVLEVARMTFPGMTDYEIMEVLLEGREEDVEEMVEVAMASEGGAGTGGGKLQPQAQVAGQRMGMGFRGGNGVVGYTNGAQEKEQEEKKEQGNGTGKGQAQVQGQKQTSSTPRPNQSPQVAAPPSSQPSSPVPPPERKYSSLSEELSTMNTTEKQHVKELMESLGLPDITKGLPSDFDPYSYPPDIQDLAKMLYDELGPGSLSVTTTTGKQSTQPTSQPQPQPQPQRPQPTLTPKPTAPIPLPPDFRSLLPPRPKYDIPDYSTDQWDLLAQRPVEPKKKKFKMHDI